MMHTITYCSFEGAKWLLFGPNVAPLVYYSHLPIAIISLILAFLILFHDRRALSNKVLFYTILTFVIWVFCDSIYWASNRSDVIMFSWAMDILFEPLVHIGALYLVYTLVAQKDLSFGKKLFLGLIYLPIIVIVPTRLALSAFDVGTCLAIETYFSYYTYVIEIFIALWVIIFSIKNYIASNDLHTKKEILFLTIGVVLFLVAFSWGNIIGSFTDDWQLGQYGLFGMPVFIGFLAYSIVKFKLFNIKVIGANVLVATLWVATASLFAIEDIDTSHVVVAGTLILTTIFGLILINSVRREVAQREHIEKLASELQKANDRLRELDKQKSEFVSFATHQLRAPLTAMKGYCSMILEGDLGDLSPTTKDAVERIYESSSTLANVVDDYLNISRIELGTMKYNFERIDIRDVVVEVIAEIQPNIDHSGVAFALENSNGPFMAKADKDKIKQVIANLIDNSIKYTPKGKVIASISRISGDGGKPVIRFETNDNGIGIAPDVLPKLFAKFTRADNGNRTNIHGTGLGLYVAKEIVGAHKGKIWAESAGEGKGSRFIVDLPAM